jgi:hypothetical protein
MMVRSYRHCESVVTARSKVPSESVFIPPSLTVSCAENVPVAMAGPPSVGVTVRVMEQLTTLALNTPTSSYVSSATDVGSGVQL